MAQNEVKLVFRVTDDGTLQILDAAGEKLRGVTKAAKEAGDAGASGFTRFQAAVVTFNQAIELAERLARAVLDPLEKIVAAASAQQDAIAGLNAQLLAQGRFSETFSRALQEQAKALQQTTVYADEVVESAQAMLAIFPRLSNDVLLRATKATTELAAAMHSDLASAARVLGIALNDPAEGLQRLGRVGIRFTEDQKKLLEQLVATGQVAKAQGLILDEIEGRLGGRAAAAARTFSGSLQQLRNEFGELLEASGNVIVESDAVQSVFANIKDELRKLTGETADYITKNRDLIESGIKDFFSHLPEDLDLAAKSIGTLAEGGVKFAQGLQPIFSFVENHPDIAKVLFGFGAGAAVGGAPGGLAGGLFGFSQTGIGQSAIDALAGAVGDLTVWAQTETVAPVATARQRDPRAIARLIAEGRAAAAELEPGGQSLLGFGDIFTGTGTGRFGTGRGGPSFGAPHVLPKEDQAAAKKALDDAEKSAQALQQATEVQGKTALAYAQSELAVFQKRVEQAEALATTENERRQIAVDAAAEELHLAQQIDDATVSVLEAQQAVNAEKAKAHDITEGEKALLAAQNAQLDQQIGLVRTTTGEVAKQKDAIALATAEWQRARQVVVNLSDTIDSSLHDAITGILAGGGPANLETVLKKSGEALVTSLAGGFIKAQLAKNEFDAKLSENFTVTLPGFFKTGADAISSTWSNLMDFLGFSGGQAASGVTQTFGDAFNSIGSGVANLGNTVAGLARNAGTITSVTPTTGQFANVVAGGSSTAAAPAAGGALSGASSAALGVATFGAVIALQAALGAADAVNAALDSIGFRNILDKEDLVRAAGKGALGGLGEVIGVAHMKLLESPVFSSIYGAIDPIGFGIINALMAFFQAPTTGSQYAQALSKEMRKAGLPEQRIYTAGGHGGGRAQDLSRLIRNADVARLAAAGFSTGIPGLEDFGATLEFMAGREPRTRYPLLQTALETQRAKHPDVDTLRYTEALGLGTILTGDLRGGVTVANEFTNNLLLLGVSAKEAEREIRRLAESAGLNLVNAIEEAQRLFQEGVFKDDTATATNEKAEQLFTTIDAVVKIFRDDIPTGVDVSAIALANFTDEAGVDIAEFNDDLEKAVKLFGQLETTITAGLGTGLASAAASFAEAQRKLDEGAPIDQIIKQSLRARGELISALFDSIRTGFTTAITDGVFNAIEDTAAWTALKDTIAAAVTGGDLSQLATVIGDVVDVSVPALEVAAQTIAQINAALAVTPTQLFGEADTLRGQATSLREQSLTSAQQEARYRKDIADADAKIAQLREGGITPEEQQQYLEALQLRETGARGLGEIASQRYDPFSAAGKAALEEAAHQEEVTANLFEEFGVSQETALGANTSATDKNTAALTRLADVLDVHQMQPSVHINWDALAGAQRPTIPTTPNAPAIWTQPPDVQRANPEKIAFTPQGMERLRIYARSR